MCTGRNRKQEKTRDGFSDFKVKLWKYQGEMGALIPCCNRPRRLTAIFPESAIDHISQIVGIPAAEIYGVITFYSQFRLRPTGKNIIKICDGTACHVNASSLIIKTIENALKVQITRPRTTGFSPCKRSHALAAAPFRRWS